MKLHESFLSMKLHWSSKGADLGPRRSRTAVGFWPFALRVAGRPAASETFEMSAAAAMSVACRSDAESAVDALPAPARAHGASATARSHRPPPARKAWPPPSAVRWPAADRSGAEGFRRYSFAAAYRCCPWQRRWLRPVRRWSPHPASFTCPGKVLRCAFQRGTFRRICPASNYLSWRSPFLSEPLSPGTADVAATRRNLRRICDTVCR